MDGADIVLAQLDRRGESLRQLHMFPSPCPPLADAADLSVGL
jgi:hypothetical protein